MIDIAKLKELVSLMTANDLTEVELKGEAGGVLIKRGSAATAPVVHYAPAPAAAASSATVPNATSCGRSSTTSATRRSATPARRR